MLKIDKVLDKFGVFLITKFRDLYHVSEEERSTIGCKTVWISASSIDTLLENANTSVEFWEMAKQLNPQ